MPTIRQLAGPAVIALAAWCASGRLTVATSESATTRLAGPAEWWVFVIAGALAALVPAWRSRPLLTLPALLSTLPWWPLPLPAVALLWTGPMAWAPIGLALVAAMEWRGTWPAGFHTSSFYVRLSARHEHVAAALTLVAGLLAAWAADPRVPGGDEPHYLVITQSLIKDGDLRIENNHAAADYAEYFGGELRPDVIVRGRNGQAYSIHAPGLPVLLAPAFSLFGYRGAQAMMIVFAALTGGLIWKVAWRATRDRRAAWFAWGAIVASTTFLIQSFTIFPDGAAALAVAAGVWLLIRLSDSGDRVSPASLVGVSAALGALPWLHTRFVVLAAGLGALVAWRLRNDLRRLATLFLPLPLVSAVSWFAFFYVIYGTPNPAAPYGPNPESSLAYVPGGFTGLLFDAQFGLFTYAPVLFAGAVCLVIFRRDAPALAHSLAIVAALYLATVGTYWMWWGGVPATPARFAAAILPVVAIPLAVFWARGSTFVRVTSGAQLAATTATSVIVLAVDRAALAWNIRGDDARWLDWLGPVADLSRAWPSFFWRLTPGVVRTEIPFFVHVLVWLALIAGAAVGVRALVQRRPVLRQHAREVVAWSCAIGLMLLVQAGWALNRVNGLDAASSQIALLESTRAGQGAIRIGALSIGAVADASAALRVRGAPPRDQSATWAALNDLPAGNYELRFSLLRPRAGDVSVRIGRAAQPWRRLSLLPLSRQSVAVFLPADVAGLTIEPEGALKDAGGSVEIVPLAARPHGSGRARAVARYRTTDVFFVDDAVFVEQAGFWVRGGAMAEVVFAAGAGTAAIDLVLTNGGASNQVRLESGTFKQAMTLRPSEQRTVTIPIAAADGVVPLQITSAAGFRPSDSSSSTDRRYLGVRVELK